SGTFLKREVPFFNHTGTSFAGIVGIDMEDPPGLQELHVQIMTETGTSHLSYSILIIEEDYAVQHLTLPKDKVDLNATVLARVREEQKELTEAFRHPSMAPLWDGAFLEPLTGRVTGVFGSRRIINGQPRRP